ncbi:MAG: hypothetical protein JSW20_10150 [Nitrospiraceae bacterium]|nr:MAG: hypothetical protein JSW20_10150 [Nitrospiraceae bacterium]
MNRLMHFMMIATCTIIISCSSSADTQSQLKKIDELQNKGFPITSEQQENIDRHVAEGKSLIQEGKEKEASEALAKAIDILNRALDADIYNKAD